MNSIKIFWNWIAQSLQESEPVAPEPFDHPAIRAMDMRELADLPTAGLPSTQVADVEAQSQQTIQLARCA